MTIPGLAVLMSAALSATTLDARFIGNSAFELSDGTATILLDFPYKSGAFGYMTFPDRELHPRKDSLCLFTHRHDDHFDASQVARIGCSVAGPAEVQATVDASLRAGPGPTWDFHGATIECLATPHAQVEHCSYLINWHGLRFFISGDIEGLQPLEPFPAGVDVLFLPAWLASELKARRSDSRVVIHHHTSNEVVPPCPGCTVPVQGSSVDVSGEEGRP